MATDTQPTPEVHSTQARTIRRLRWACVVLVLISTGSICIAYLAHSDPSGRAPDVGQEKTPIAADQRVAEEAAQQPPSTRDQVRGSASDSKISPEHAGLIEMLRDAYKQSRPDFRSYRPAASWAKAAGFQGSWRRDGANLEVVAEFTFMNRPEFDDFSWSQLIPRTSRPRPAALNFQGSVGMAWLRRADRIGALVLVADSTASTIRLWSTPPIGTPRCERRSWEKAMEAVRANIRRGGGDLPRSYVPMCVVEEPITVQVDFAVPIDLSRERNPGQGSMADPRPQRKPPERARGGASIRGTRGTIARLRSKSGLTGWALSLTVLVVLTAITARRSRVARRQGRECLGFPFLDMLLPIPLLAGLAAYALGLWAVGYAEVSPPSSGFALWTVVADSLPHVWLVSMFGCVFSYFVLTGVALVHGHYLGAAKNLSGFVASGFGFVILVRIWLAALASA